MTRETTFLPGTESPEFKVNMHFHKSAYFSKMSYGIVLTIFLEHTLELYFYETCLFANDWHTLSFGFPQLSGCPHRVEIQTLHFFPFAEQINYLTFNSKHLLLLLTFNIHLLFCVLYYVGVQMKAMCAWGNQRATCWAQFSSSTTWFPGIELKSPGLVVDAFIYWDMI